MNPIEGIGPAPAIRKLCERTGIPIKDVDLFDVNEAFAPQFLSVEKELGSRKISVYRFFGQILILIQNCYLYFKNLGLDPSKTNVNGGAIALGHRKSH